MTSEDLTMSNTNSKNISGLEAVLVTLLFSFLGYIVSSFIVFILSINFLEQPISSSLFWNVLLANFIVLFCILLFLHTSPVAKLIGLLLFFSINFYLGTYKQSTARYYLNAGTYMNPELYPENSNQRKLVTDVIAHKDMSLLGQYDTTYFTKVDINKLGNMTNFFMTYGQRNEQMKLYETKFKELLNSQFLTEWDYTQFENEVVSYLTNSETALKQNESVSMIHTIKFGA